MTDPEYRPLFLLGKCGTTQEAQAFLTKHSINPESLLRRHASGDWGDMSDDDKAANNEALETGKRILSSYEIKGNTVHILTVELPDKGRRTVIALHTET